MKRKILIICCLIIVIIISGAIIKLEISSNKIIKNIVKMEVSLFDVNSQEGITYTDPVLVDDKNEIKDILEIINSSTIYPDDEFEAKYGAGGYFEGAPELTLYDSKGNKYVIMALDNFDIVDNTPLNIFYISKKEDRSDKILYKTNSRFEEKIKSLVEENNEWSAENINYFLQLMAFLNQKNDVNYIGMTDKGIKLDIASYFVRSYKYNEDGMVSYKREDIKNSMKEVFNEELDIKTEGAYGLKYDKKSDTFCYEAGGDGSCFTYLVKIENEEYSNGVYDITFIYAYPDEANFNDGTVGECDCYKTQVKIKENENYIYSKFQLLNQKEMKSKYVGKVKDFR